MFMTFTTLTTIGYGEVKPLDSTGRWLNMVVGGTGSASLFYMFGATMDYLVVRQLSDMRGMRCMPCRRGSMR